MNPDAPQPPPDEREARLTALLLGELPVAEAESLHAEIAADADLAKVFRRLSLAHELTRETVRSPEPKELAKPEALQLSAERRAALLAKFKTPPANVVPLPKRERQPRFDWRELIAVAAMLVAVVGAAGMLLPTLAKAKSKSQGLVGPQTSDLLGESAARIVQTQSSPEPAEVAERIQPRIENESRNQVLADTPAPVPPPPSEPSQNPRQMDQVLDRRPGMVPAEKRSLAEAIPMEEEAGDVVAVDPSSVTFAIEVKGATVTSPALAGGVGGGRAGGHGVNWAFNGVTPNAPANAAAAAPAAVALGLQSSPSVVVNSNPESSARLLDRELEPLARESEQVGKSVELFAQTPAAGRQFFDASGLINAPANGPTAGLRGEPAAARPQSDDYSETAAGHGVAAARKDFGTVAVDPADRSNGRLDGFYRFVDPTKPADKFAPGEQALDLKRRSAVGQQESDPIEERFGVALAAPKLEKTVEELRGGELALDSIRLAPQRGDGPVPVANQAGAELRGLQAEFGVAQIAERTESPAAREQIPSRPTVLASLADGRDGKSAAASPAQSTPLADIMALGQQVAAYQPDASRTDQLGLATNAAVPALGDVPALGRVFTRKVEAGTAAAVKGGLPAEVTDSKGRKLADVIQDPAKAFEVPVENAVDRVAVKEIAEAWPNDQLTLLSKLRQVLGGETTRTVRLKVEKDTPDIQLLGYFGGNQTYDPNFLQSEFEVIKSRRILDRAIKELNAQRGQADAAVSPEAYKQLADKVTVTQEGKSSVLSIQVADKDPAQAARIANAIAKAYSDTRNMTRRDGRNERGIAVLKEKVKELDLQIAAKKARVEEMARELGIDDTSSPSNDAVQGKVDQTVTKPADAPLPKLAPGAPEPPEQLPSTGHQGLAELIQERDRLHSVMAQNALDSDIAKRSSVEVLDQAVADSRQRDTLLGRVKQAFGGDVSRVARILPQRDTRGSRLEVGLFGKPAYASNFLSDFTLDQLETVRSQEVLWRAAVTLGWSTNTGISVGKSSAVDKLRELLSANVYRGSSIIEIHARSQTPEEAARIANAVANAYAEHLKDQESQRIFANEKAIQQRIAELDRQIAVIQPPRPTAAEATSRLGDAPLPKLAPGAPEPQPEVATADNAFSTFSLNVSDVSFKLAAAALEKGQMPDPATVRTEEFINAFDYRDPEPAGAAPIAFAWERARYPFAHDRDLVRFSVKTAASGRQPGRPLNLVLLLDNSGSMERADRIRIRQECLRVLAGQLQPQDRVSVVAFARTPRLWLDGLPGDQAAALPERVGQLTPDGGTNLEEASRTAYRTAARHFLANGVNRVVLFTDGAANLGDVQPDSLRQQVEANRKQGIALDCFGIGWEGLNDELLEALSRNGDGRYGFVNTPESAQDEFAAQLVGALQVAASDVKVQVEWNPKRVTAYRQLGYAKHQLTKEQFRDNTVDAAEIGAAEAGNALYTVQVNPAGEGPLGTVRVRFRLPGTDDYREHEWPLHYDGTSAPLDQAGPALRLAASASAFSEWLVSSPWAGEVTPDRLLGLLNGVPQTYAADPRPKQFEQMLRQAKALGGR